LLRRKASADAAGGRATPGNNDAGIR